MSNGLFGRQLIQMKLFPGLQNFSNCSNSWPRFFQKAETLTSTLSRVKWRALSQFLVARVGGLRARGMGLPLSFLRKDMATENRVTLGSPYSSIESKLSRLKKRSTFSKLFMMWTEALEKVRKKTRQDPPSQHQSKSSYFWLKQ